MKRLIAAVAVVTAASTAAWFSRTEDRPVQSDEASFTGQLQQSYDSLPALVEDAREIVIADVVGSTPKPFENLPFTELAVEVQETLKGDIKPGSQLQMLETGGQWTGRAKQPGLAPPQPVEVGFEGVPVMKAGERYILFLTPYSGPITQGAYRPLGVYQGKFKIGASGQIEFSGNPAKLSEPEFAVLESVIGRSVSEVTAEIHNLTGAESHQATAQSLGEHCGSETIEHGSGYDLAARTCLWDAYTAGRSATFETTSYTQEGDPVHYRIAVQSDGQVDVLVESQDRLGQAGTFRYTCGKLDRRFHSEGERFSFEAADCVGDKSTVLVP